MIPLKDNLKCKVFPWATLVIVAINFLAWFYELKVQAGGRIAFEQFMYDYCFVPVMLTDALKNGHLAMVAWSLTTVFMAMFLHGSWMHITFNMIYLMVFGYGVEARLGHQRYVAFYLVGGICATLAQWLSNPTDIWPCLGASGAIAGILGGYLMFWAKARVIGIVPCPPFLVESWAFLYIPCWIALQLIAASGLLSVAEGIAYFAHIGGFFSGLAMAFVWKLLRPFSDVCCVPTSCCGGGPCRDAACGNHQES